MSCEHVVGERERKGGGLLVCAWVFWGGRGSVYALQCASVLRRRHCGGGSMSSEFGVWCGELERGVVCVRGGLLLRCDKEGV